MESQPPTPSVSSSFPSKSKGMSMFLQQQQKHAEEEATSKPSPVTMETKPSRPPIQGLTKRPASPRKFGPAPSAKSKGLAMFLSQKDKLTEPEEKATDPTDVSKLDAPPSSLQSPPPAAPPTSVSPLIGRATPIQIKQEQPQPISSFHKQGTRHAAFPVLHQDCMQTSQVCCQSYNDHSLVLTMNAMCYTLITLLPSNTGNDPFNLT